MAVTGDANVILTAMWPQGDVRDPIGLWGFRTVLVGDATGGSLKVTAQVPANRSAGQIFCAYAATITQIVGTPNTGTGKVRLLTNWPDIDETAGIAAFATTKLFTLFASTNFSAPTTGPLDVPLISTLDRFLLLGDPRSRPGGLAIMELEFDENVLDDQLSFEGYGYYWDRGIWNAPGGPRHPGSS